jgi:hypothetical protein
MQPTFGNQTLPPAVASENMSTGTKVGLVTALTALAVAGVYIATRGKVKNKPSNFSKVCEEVCEEVKGEVVNNNKPNWVLVDKPSKTTRGKVKNKVLNSLRKRGGKVKNRIK